MGNGEVTDIELPEEIKAISEKINTKDFKILQMLGRGTFGKVMLVEHTETGELYALKALKKSKIIKLLQVEHTKSERKYLNVYSIEFLKRSVILSLFLLNMPFKRGIICI